MLSPFVLTLVGPDRPGLVDLVATTIAQHGGNWLESRMARLGGQFAGILRADVPSERRADLARALQDLSTHGLTLVIHSGTGTPSTQASQGSTATLELLGHDRPGIVRQISGALARHQVNVEELETGTESAPMTGDILFRAHAQLQIPAGCDMAALQTELERIAADLMVDVSLRPR